MDYKDRLPSQDEIDKSLDNYFNAFHAQINMIGDLSPDKIYYLRNKKYFLDISIEKLINDFVNIYGYIFHEYVYGNPSSVNLFFRGTNLQEAKSYNSGTEIGSILSVVSDEHKEIANRFLKDENAILRIKMGDFPYVYVEDKKNRGGNIEYEFLIAPFTKVKECTFSSRWNGISYYDMTIVSQELPEIDDDELQKTKEDLVKEFPNFMGLVKTYNSLRENIGIYKDRDVINEKRNTLAEQRSRIDQYRKKFINMLKGLCRQREKDLKAQREDEIKAFEKEYEEKRKKEHEELIR